MATTTLDKIKQSAADLQSPDPKKRARAEEIKRRYEQGLFNPELIAEGAKPVPIPKQKSIDVAGAIEQAQKAPGGMSMAPRSSYAGDMMSDVGDVAQKYVTEDIPQRWENVKDIASKAGREQGVLSTALQLGGQAVGTIVDAGERLFEGAARAILPPQFEQYVSEKGKQLLQTEGGQVAVAALQAGQEKWNQFKQENPEFAANIEATMNVGEILGFGAISRPVEAGAKAALETVAKTPDVLLKGQETLAKTAGSAGKVLDKVADSRKAAREKELTDAVGRILQAKTPADIAAGKKVLGTVDLDGLKTYKDLNTRLEENIRDLSTIMDTELEQYGTKLKLEQLSKKTKVGDTEVAQSPVADALDGLENAYKQSGDPVSAEKVSQLRQKLESEGLTVKELNDLAKEYGVEFKNRAFDKMGNPKQGYNAESFENIRSNLKSVIREQLPDDVAKEIDSQLSAIYRVQKLTAKREQDAMKLYQRLKRRSLAHKVGGGVADVLDLLSMGTLRGFVQKIVPPNMGLKTANSLDLEAALPKEMAKIEKLLAIKDEAQFEKALTDYVNEVQPGLSTRVKSGLSDGEKDQLLTQLMATDSKSSLIGVDYDTRIPREDLDIEAFTRLEELKKAANQRALTEREYLELRELLTDLSD